MTETIYFELLRALTKSDKAGLGYIEDFVKVFDIHHTELNIGNIVTVWDIPLSNATRRIFRFSTGAKFSLKSFNLDSLMENGQYLDSHKDDFRPFKTENSFNGFHIISIPVIYETYQEHLLKIKGVILLFSLTGIDMTTEQLDTLFLILKNLKPSTINHPLTIKAMNALVSEQVPTKEISLEHRYLALDEALDTISSKDTPPLNEHGLRHFSFWTYDKIPNNPIFKEFNKNTFNHPPHDNTHELIFNENHYVYHYIHLYLEGHTIDETEKYIAFYSYDEIKDSIKDEQYFKQLELGNDNTTVAVVPIVFDECICIACFYLKDIEFSPFISLEVFTGFSKAIKQHFTLINEINIKNKLGAMMDSFSSINQYQNYYQTVAEILKKGNEADECLIYFYNEKEDRYILVTHENENDSKSLQEANINEGGIKFYLPTDYFSDKNFVSSYLLPILREKRFHSVYSNNGTVKTACLIAIEDKKELSGFILLFNKRHQPRKESTHFNNTFLYNNIYITKSCCPYLTLCRRHQILISNKNDLLMKLRHEIPDCTSAIRERIRNIKNNINRPDYRRNYLLKDIELLAVNNDRIYMLAAFFSTVGYDDKRFLETKTSFNLESFMISKINTFRMESTLRGVYVKYNIGIDTPTLQVSIFYQLAITNIIINAMRYAAPGTTVWIKTNSDTIEISDIGIPIHDKEKQLIFKEGYRGIEAKRINSRGMGYGLPLVKRILDLYGHPIQIECRKVSNHNPFAMNAVYKGLKNMTQTEAGQFMYTDVSEGEMESVSRLYYSLNNSLQKIESQYRYYANDNTDNINTWLEHIRDNNTTFLDMEEECFEQPIYEVKFIIHIY